MTRDIRRVKNRRGGEVYSIRSAEPSESNHNTKKTMEELGKRGHHLKRKRQEKKELLTGGRRVGRELTTHSKLFVTGQEQN